jgi:hypothetical protein
MDLPRDIVEAIAKHPDVRTVELTGSRARGDARPESDWDFLIEAREFDSAAQSLPGLLAFLDPLAEQWDRLSDEECWMLILRGPTKVDLIFPDEPHEHAPPWIPSADNLSGIDAHFWDWMLWLNGKAARGNDELVATELRRLFDHILEPLGASNQPTSIGEAVFAYRDARARIEKALGRVVSRRVENAVAPVLRMQRGSDPSAV